MITQFGANAIVAGCYYAVIAVGFVIVFRARLAFDFGYAACYLVAPYFALFACRVVGLPFILGAFAGIGGSLAFAATSELLLYRQMRYRGASSLTVMLVSFGVLILSQNVISIAFGNEAMTLRTWSAREGYNVFGARITSAQLLTVVCAAGLLVFTHWFLRFTAAGKKLRAVANNLELAHTAGIAVDSVILQACLLGAALAATAAVLVGLDTDLTPGMGLPALLVGVVVCIVGGVDRMGGTVLAAFLLACIQQLGIWAMGTQWQDAIAFLVLLIFLFFRPQGFWGRKVKKAMV